MTPETCATIHAKAFAPSARPWAASEIRALLDSPHVFLIARAQAFALGRVIVDEAELLTIATAPCHQQRGLGADCLRGFEEHAQHAGATRAFLEVNETNQHALSLYKTAGYEIIDRRQDYYVHDGVRSSALVLSKSLNILKTAPTREKE